MGREFLPVGQQVNLFNYDLKQLLKRTNSFMKILKDNGNLPTYRAYPGSPYNPKADDIVGVRAVLHPNLESLLDSLQVLKSMINHCDII